jgi:hypothetical protein
VITFVITAEPGASDGAPDRLADRVDLDDVLLDHGVRREGLEGVMVDAVAGADLAQLQELDRRRADVDADEWCLRRTE